MNRRATPSEPKSWVEVVANIRRTLDVAFLINQRVYYTPDGAKALSELMLRMATALDMARELVEEKDKDLERKDALLTQLVAHMEEQNARNWVDRVRGFAADYWYRVHRRAGREARDRTS